MENPCAEGEFVCDSGLCSVNSLCGSLEVGAEEEEQEPTPPVLTMVGAKLVIVEMGYKYVKCTAKSPAGAICDRGATAVDEADGDVTDRVLACSPDGVTGRWSTRGVTRCESGEAVGQCSTCGEEPSKKLGTKQQQF